MKKIGVIGMGIMVQAFAATATAAKLECVVDNGMELQVIEQIDETRRGKPVSLELRSVFGDVVLNRSAEAIAKDYTYRAARFATEGCEQLEAERVLFAVYFDSDSEEVNGDIPLYGEFFLTGRSGIRAFDMECYRTAE